MMFLLHFVLAALAVTGGEPCILPVRKSLPEKFGIQLLPRTRPLPSKRALPLTPLGPPSSASRRASPPASPATLTPLALVALAHRRSRPGSPLTGRVTIPGSHPTALIARASRLVSRPVTPTLASPGTTTTTPLASPATLTPPGPAARTALGLTTPTPLARTLATPTPAVRTVAAPPLRRSRIPPGP